MTHVPAQAIQIDVSKGEVTAGSGRELLLGAETTLLLLKAAKEDQRLDAGKRVGAAAGKSASESLRKASLSAQSAAPEAVLNHLAGELAARGFGVLSLERWGKALVAKIDNAPVDDDVFLSGMLSAAFTALSDGGAAKLEAATLAKHTFLIAKPETAKKAKDMAKLERNYGVVVAKLQGGR
jgi:hypothetical protein